MSDTLGILFWSALALGQLIMLAQFIVLYRDAKKAKRALSLRRWIAFALASLVLIVWMLAQRWPNATNPAQEAVHDREDSTPAVVE